MAIEASETVFPGQSIELLNPDSAEDKKTLVAYVESLIDRVATAAKQIEDRYYGNLPIDLALLSSATNQLAEIRFVESRLKALASVFSGHAGAADVIAQAQEKCGRALGLAEEHFASIKHWFAA